MEGRRKDIIKHEGCVYFIYLFCLKGTVVPPLQDNMSLVCALVEEITCRSPVTGRRRLQEDMKRRVACTSIRPDFYHSQQANAPCLMFLLSNKPI